jgi:hypothetical protein
VRLYAEGTGPNGEAFGNSPQAFTRLALIIAAYNLYRTLDWGRWRNQPIHSKLDFIHSRSLNK